MSDEQQRELLLLKGHARRVGLDDEGDDGGGEVGEDHHAREEAEHGEDERHLQIR